MISTPRPLSTIVEVLRRRAANSPSRIAYAQLAAGSAVEQHLTCEDLDRQAAKIAAVLCKKGARETPVLLLLPSSLSFIVGLFGCFYASAIAVPLFPPRPNRSFQRIKNIVIDCGSKIVLSDRKTMDRVLVTFTDELWLQDLEWIVVDDVVIEPDTNSSNPGTASDTIALLQYTSGSTSEPKGVVVQHKHLMSNAEKIWEPLQICRDAVVVGWLPMFHDLGLIGYVLSSLYGGVPYYFMTPESFLMKPNRWLEAISTYRACISGAPSFAYELCVRRANSKILEGLDLSCWRIAFCGGENIDSRALQKFADTFAPSGFNLEAFYPSYGLAEATLFVTGGIPGYGLTCKNIDSVALKHDRVEPAVSGKNARTITSCGRLWSNSHKIVIVDPKTRAECAPGEVGEIWISGEGVAAGYWNRPDETLETFQAGLTGADQRQYLRTGDLGFMDENELYVVGRIKEMIIIGGMNHYPQDIELTVVDADEKLRTGCCAAFATEGDPQERLSIIIEIDREIVRDSEAGELAQLVEKIHQAVWNAHDIHASLITLVKPGALARTTSGKIQRLKSRDDLAEGLLRTIDTEDH